MGTEDGQRIKAAEAGAGNLGGDQNLGPAEKLKVLAALAKMVNDFLERRRQQGGKKGPSTEEIDLDLRIKGNP